MLMWKKAEKVWYPKSKEKELRERIDQEFLADKKSMDAGNPPARLYSVRARYRKGVWSGSFIQFWELREADNENL